MTKDEALKLALKALEAAEIDGNCEYGVTEIIREALAQPAPAGMLHIDRLDKWLDASLKKRKTQPGQEPVAMRYDFDGYGWRYIDNGSGSDWQTRVKDSEPVYLTPPHRPWVGLTENEIEAIEEKALTKQWAIRMALTAAKEKNTK